MVVMVIKETIMYKLLLLSLCGVISLRASDDAAKHAQRDFVHLIKANTILGVKVEGDQSNIAKIKEHYEKYKDEIDLNASNERYHNGCTLLQTACRHASCGVDVVTFLCEKGAKLNKGDGALTPGTWCIYNIYQNSAPTNAATRDVQLQKLVILKQHAAPEKLEIDLYIKELISKHRAPWLHDKAVLKDIADEYIPLLQDTTLEEFGNSLKVD